MQLRDDSWPSTLRVLLLLRLLSLTCGPTAGLHTHVDSVNVTGGTLQAVRLVNRDLSSWTLLPEAFAKPPNEGTHFRMSCFTECNLTA